MDRARGSLFEVDSFLVAAHDMRIISELQLEPLAAAVLRLNAVLHALRRSLREKARAERERDF